MARTTELEAAYRATRYRVFLPGGAVELRVDVPDDRLKAWLKAAGCASYAIVTAWNPGSRPLAAQENVERQSRLECELLEGNYEVYAGENLPDGAGPAEESCFVPGIALEDAVALAGDYGQNAIVAGGNDAVPRLIWIEDTQQ